MDNMFFIYLAVVVVALIIFIFFIFKAYSTNQVQTTTKAKTAHAKVPYMESDRSPYERFEALYGINLYGFATVSDATNNVGFYYKPGAFNWAKDGSRKLNCIRQFSLSVPRFDILTSDFSRMVELIDMFEDKHYFKGLKPMESPLPSFPTNATITEVREASKIRDGKMIEGTLKDAYDALSEITTPLEAIEQIYHLQVPPTFKVTKLKSMGLPWSAAPKASIDIHGVGKLYLPGGLLLETKEGDTMIPVLEFLRRKYDIPLTAYELYREEPKREEVEEVETAEEEVVIPSTRKEDTMYILQRRAERNIANEA